MKHIIAFWMAACLAAGSLYALDLRGRVVDENRQPIEFASVAAFAGDSIVAGCVTDSTGGFSLSASSRADRLRISYEGYEELDMPVDSFASDFRDLGIMEMKQSATTLREVTVTAPLIRREADRIVLNVAANPLSANKTAQELLKTAPGVWATDESLSIYGQAGTAVYVDDNKVNMSGPQLVAYLKTLQSSSIATIEIIPKGGAEYAADSSGGIIRINLKKVRDDGMLGVAGLNLTGGEEKVWINPFANISLHSGKWTFNLSGNINGSPVDKHTTREQSSNSVMQTRMYGLSRHRDKKLSCSVTLGGFCQATARDHLGIQVDYHPDRSNQRSQSLTVVSGNAVGTTSGSYINDYRFHNINVALNWRHKLNPDGSELKWISNYNRQMTSTDERNRMSWEPSQADSVYNTDNLDRYDIFATELSLKKILPHGWRMNAGAKYTRNDMRYRSDHEFLSDGRWVCDRKFDYDDSFVENIAAIYLAAGGESGRWKYKVGLRGEFWHSSTRASGTRDFGLFPNANLSYSITAKGDCAVSLGYYRNIRRPSFWALSPIVRQVSDYSYTVGNPALRSSILDAVSLDVILAGKFTVAGGYSHTSDAIRQMFRSDPAHPERMYLTWGNAGEIHSGFIHADGFIRPVGWLSLYAGATYVVERQRLGDESASETNGYVQVVGSVSFILPRGFNLSLNCFYNSPMTIGNIKVYPILNLNPTIQKRLGRHWSISLGVENLLRRTSGIRTRSAGYDRLTSTRNSLSVKLGISYDFNSGKRFNSHKIEKNTDPSRLSKE